MLLSVALVVQPKMKAVNLDTQMGGVCLILSTSRKWIDMRIEAW